MLKYSDEQYEELKEKSRKDYSQFQSVKCPALKNISVYFTSEGFNHIVYKNKKHERSKKDQFVRFQVLHDARKIIEKTTTVQEIEDIHKEVVVKIRKKREKILKFVSYWGFIAIINNKKLKVIIKREGSGKCIFWSVIPYWKTTKHGDHFFKDFTSGNLDED